MAFFPSAFACEVWQTESAKGVKYPFLVEMQLPYCGDLALNRKK